MIFSALGSRSSYPQAFQERLVGDVELLQGVEGQDQGGKRPAAGVKLRMKWVDTGYEVGRTEEIKGAEGKIEVIKMS